MRLPRVPIDPSARREREKLARWIAEWQVDNALRDTEEPPAAAGATSAAEGDLPIEAGQVRLLFPDTAATAARPRYVAALAKKDGDLWLIAPFGRLSEPATPGELRMETDSLLVRVLCVWNARLVPTGRLAASWLVATLSEEQQSNAAELIEVLTQGKPLPEHISDMVGPPLLHPLDPRGDYLKEERQWMDQVVPSGGLRVCEGNRSSVGPEQVRYPTRQTIIEDLRKAADSRTDYNAKPQEPSSPGHNDDMD